MNLDQHNSACPCLRCRAARAERRRARYVPKRVQLERVAAQMREKYAKRKGVTAVTA